jgi:hypothetical protein
MTDMSMSYDLEAGGSTSFRSIGKIGPRDSIMADRESKSGMDKSPRFHKTPDHNQKSIDK